MALFPFWIVVLVLWLVVCIDLVGLQGYLRILYNILLRVDVVVVVMVVVICEGISG